MDIHGVKVDVPKADFVITWDVYRPASKYQWKMRESFIKNHVRIFKSSGRISQVIAIKSINLRLEVACFYLSCLT